MGNEEILIVQKCQILYNLETQYNGVTTIPGTRSYHCFIPESGLLLMKIVTTDQMCY